MRSFASFKGLAACTVFAVAACSDNPNAPTTITNPAATFVDLFAVDSAFDSDAFRSLQTLTDFIVLPTAPLPLARLAAVLRVTLPPAPAAAARGALRRDLPRRDARLLGGLVSASSQPPVLPDTLLGTTFVWEPDSLHYVASTRSGAPLNGIRFVLYETDPLTSLPDTAAAVGSLDIIDLAPAAGAQLRFLVRGVTGSPTFLDYTLTYLAGAGAHTIGANGFLSNGAPGARERRFTFTAAITATETTGGADGTVAFTYDLNVPDVTVELNLATSEDTLQDSSLLAIDYRFTRRNENIRFVGGDTTTAGGNTENGQFVVTVNGHLYATLTITDNIGVVTDANGDVVPANDGDQRHEDEVIVFLYFGVLHATLILGSVLSIPAFLLGFSIGLV